MTLEIVRPDSVAGAVVLLADPSARMLGGGTLLVRDISAGDLSVRTLVLGDRLGLDQIRIEGGRVTLGAAVTMAKVAAHPGLAFLHPVVSEIGGPAVRNMATVGGNLFAPAPYGDLTAPLLVLMAEIGCELSKQQETIAAEAFLASRASRGGLVKSISFAPPTPGAFRFRKVTRRHPHGASVLSIAALLPVVDGEIKGARVAYGGMAPTAIRARAVEAVLEGQSLPKGGLDAATIAKAASVANDGTAPETDAFASDWYRRAVLPVHLSRLLQE